MNARIRLFAGLVALALVQVGSVRAQKRMTPEEMLSALKPGQWVKVEGTAQGDSSVICEEVHILVGSFLDDEWSIIGVVRAVEQENRKLEILRLPIRIDEDAEFERKNKDHGFGIADLKVGMFLEVGGTYLKDGTLLANEVEDKSAKQEKEYEIRAEGRWRKSMLPITNLPYGIAFQITDKARGRSAFK
jgi:hypothetical protein